MADVKPAIIDILKEMLFVVCLTPDASCSIASELQKRQKAPFTSILPATFTADRRLPFF
ncbi:MAG: hypothetical protein ABWX58_08125 [Psychrobacillus psychrotolerans]